MKSIFVHINPYDLPFSEKLKKSTYTFDSIPEYANIAIKQCEEFLKEKPILITNNYINENYTTEVVDFFNLCETGFKSFYSDPFWLLTLLRLYVLFLYCKEHNINEFVHLEYDNLIYSDLEELKQLPSSLYFTRVGPYCSSAGFIYCNSLKSFELFINKIKQLLKKGQHTVRQFTQYEQLSEMILIDLIYTNTKNIIDYLPILPFGVGSDNFSILNRLYDGASYGQYIGGTNNGDLPGWAGRHHYIGNAILDEKIKVVFDKKPFVYYNNKKIPVTNLHIHSKKLKDFIYEQ